MSEVSKRSPVNKLARLARLAEARLGRPTNKKRWGTLVEAAKNANVKKLLSRSRSDESLSSENANDNSGEPDDKSTTYSIEEITQTTPLVGILRTTSEDSKKKDLSIRNSNPNSETLPLDPAALDKQHKTVKSFVSRVRSKKNKATVSFDCPIEEGNEDSDEHNKNESTIDLKSISSGPEEETNDENSIELQSYPKSPSEEDILSPKAQKSSGNSPRLERCSISSSSIKILKSPTIYDTQYHTIAQHSKPLSSSIDSLKRNSSSVANSKENVSELQYDSSTLKIGHVSSEEAENSNPESGTDKSATSGTYELRHLPGIQPISRNMSAGWL